MTAARSYKYDEATDSFVPSAYGPRRADVRDRSTPLAMWLIFDGWLVAVGFLLGWWLT